MCLKDLRDEFIYDCECRHLAKGSVRNYKAATRFLLEYLELKQITELEDVRPRHIRDLMKKKQDAAARPAISTTCSRCGAHGSTIWSMRAIWRSGTIRPKR